MPKKKTLRRISKSKSKGRKNVVAVKPIRLSEGTLFPEKLAKANELLKNAKMMDF
ncbi:hypothetical protein [Niastella sp. OAS944]|uniref:hypothetical protein n=1 Tax=Niastella sp. OAS944 TaxID=2664089 RepID=UPI00349144A0|nr:hypothetical protein [Chitinophagaceae bacterium OAS944]